jgi:hypothetical protein
MREPVRDSEPDRDLKIEDFSAKPEAEEREPDRDLKSEDFSARLEIEDREPVKVLARPLA